MDISWGALFVGLIIGACTGACGMGLLAGGKIQKLERRLDEKTNDHVSYLRKACGDCYDLKQLRKQNSVLRGDNKKIHTIIQGDPRGARVLYDLWSAKNPVSPGVDKP